MFKNALAGHAQLRFFFHHRHLLQREPHVFEGGKRRAPHRELPKCAWFRGTSPPLKSSSMSCGRSSPDRSCAAPSSTVIRASNVDSVKSRRCACATNRFGAAPRITAVDRGKHLYTTIGETAQAPAIFWSAFAAHPQRSRRPPATNPFPTGTIRRGRRPPAIQPLPFPRYRGRRKRRSRLPQAPRQRSATSCRRVPKATDGRSRQHILRAVQGAPLAIHGFGRACGARQVRKPLCPSNDCCGQHCLRKWVFTEKNNGRIISRHQVNFPIYFHRPAWGPPC